MLLKEFLETNEADNLRIGTKENSDFIYIGKADPKLITKLNRKTKSWHYKGIQFTANRMGTGNSISIMENKLAALKEWKSVGDREVLDCAWSTVDDSYIIIIEGCEKLVDYNPDIGHTIHFDNCADALLFAVYLPIVKELKHAYRQIADTNLSDKTRKKAVKRAAECERDLLNDEWNYFHGAAPGLIKEIRKAVQEEKHK